jgi:hypothetical protein
MLVNVSIETYFTSIKYELEKYYFSYSIVLEEVRWNKLKKKTILFFTIATLLLFAIVYFDPLRKDELRSKIEVKGATAGVHKVIAAFEKAYIHDDHDSGLNGAGEWYFLLYDNNNNELGPKYMERDGPGWCDFPDLFFEDYVSGEVHFTVKALESDSFVFPLWPVLIEDIDESFEHEVSVPLHWYTSNVWHYDYFKKGDVTFYWRFYIYNEAPTIAAFSGPDTANYNEWTIYTATGVDTDGDSLEYECQIDDGTIFTASSTNSFDFYSPSTYAPTTGSYTLKVRAKDYLGTYSDWSTKSVTVLLPVVIVLPPEGSIIIDNGAAYTTSTQVTLSLTYYDADPGVDKVRYTNAYEWGSEPWEDPATTKAWTLTSGEGTKYVSYQIRDKGDLLSETYWDDIVLDTTPPTGSIIINGGDATTTSTSATLSLTYDDATSGVDKVRYTNNDVWGSEPWEDPAATKAWTLTSGEGTKHVRYQIRDNAGLISDTCWDEIYLEVNDPPNVGVVSGLTSGYRDVEYTWMVSALDPDGDSLTYEWYVDGTYKSGGSSFSHTFGSGDTLGGHEIKVRVQDSKGAYSGFQVLTFTLTDVPNDPPTISGITGPDSSTIGETCTFTASVTDPDGDDVTITWYINGSSQTTGTSFTYTFDTEAAGAYLIQARAQDSKGASSSYATLTFTLTEDSGMETSYFYVPFEDEVYVVETCSNSSVSDLIFNEDLMRVQFNVDGDSGEPGYCNVTIPSELLSGDFTVFMDNNQLVENEDYTVKSNSTHSTLGINYEHGAQVIDVIEVFGIPDFASWLALPFLMLATLTAIMSKRYRKQRKLV